MHKSNRTENKCINSILILYDCFSILTTIFCTIIKDKTQEYLKDRDY